jgi:hypothetical protein
MGRRAFVLVTGMCYPCCSGDHSKKHGVLGCMVYLAKPPQDRFCQCVEPGVTYSSETYPIVTLRGSLAVRYYG